MDILLKDGFLTVGQQWKPGDMPPNGYIDRQEWAEVQMKAGLRQKRCAICGKWKFPQEIPNGKTCPDCPEYEGEYNEQDYLDDPSEYAVEPVAAKLVHMAKGFSNKGQTSALCFKKQRAINLKKESWAIEPSGVTCPKCLEIMKEKNEQADQ